MSESARYGVEQVVVQNFRRRKAELAVAQRHIQQAFAEQVPDHSRIDHGTRQSFGQMPVGLLHGSPHLPPVQVLSPHRRLSIRNVVRWSPYSEHDLQLMNVFF